MSAGIKVARLTSGSSRQRGAFPGQVLAAASAPGRARFSAARRRRSWSAGRSAYLGGWGYIAETTDGGQTWSEWGDPLNQGTPGMEPGALTVDKGAVTQTLYAGFSGVWAHSRPAPQPGAGVTVTAQASALSARAGATVTVSSLVVDQHVNWVADGTVVTFATSPVGSFASSTITRTTTNGRASATLTGVTYGTAAITVTAGTGMDTLTVDFVPFKLYLPLVMKNY